VKLKRLRFYVLAGLVLGELFYVGAFEWAARGGHLARWINPRPERSHLAFRSAHSYFPFRITLEGLDLSVQTPRLQWRLRSETASGWIPPLPLLLRRLRVEAARLEGAELGLRRRAETPPDPAFRDPGLPPGANLPASDAEVRWLAPRPAWSFEFPRLTATRIRGIRLEQVGLTGELQARGGFSIRRRSEAEVGRSRIELSAGTLTLEGIPVAHRLHGALAFSTSPYAYRTHRGLDALPFLDAAATLEGEIAVGTLLGRYLARAPWIEVDDSPAVFDAALELRRGVLVEGSHLHTGISPRSVRLFGFEARGASQVRFDVRSDEAGGRADLLLTVDDYELRRGPAGPAVVGGSGLSVLATTRDLRPRGLPDDGKVRIDLGQAQILDLAGFSDLLPPSAGLELAGGQGEVHGSLEASLGGRGGGGSDGKGGAGTAIGSLTARVRDATLVSNGVRFRGGFSLDLPLASRDLAARAFDLAGARMELVDFAAVAAPDAAPPEAGGWWGRAELASGELRLVDPATADGTFAIHLRDTVPLVGLYATRKDLPKWVERLFEEKDVRATGSFAYRKPELTIEDLTARFENWGFDAKLELRKDRRRGLLLLEWRKLALGVRIDGDQRTYKLRDARGWFAREQL